MRILLLTETLPFPLDSGGRIKTYHTLRALSAAHEVHCHAFIRRPEQRQLAGALEPCCASLTLHLLAGSVRREGRAVARSLVGGVPFTIARHFDRAVVERLRRHSRTVAFHAAYYDHLSMLEYGKHLLLPVIHDAHNLEFRLLRRHAATLGLGPLRLFAEREWRLVRAYERQAYGACRLIFAVSEQDAEGIRALAGDTVPVRVLPIAVDAAGMTPVRELTMDPSVLLAGGLHWPPNADAARYFVTMIWPLIRAELPVAQLTVVGRDDAAVAGTVRAAAGVHVTGYVDDIAPFFARARVMVVPLRSGGGMRVKILDALARGVPVVSTRVGCEGIDAVRGVHLLVADEPGDFAREVLRVLREPGLGERLAAEGRHLVLERYDAAVVGVGLRRVMADFAGAEEPRA